MRMANWRRWLRLARCAWTCGFACGVAEPLLIEKEGAVPWGSTALDDVDQRIVAALIADGRMSMRSLASQVHISRANVYARVERLTREGVIEGFEADRKSTRLNSSHVAISYAVFCLKKKILNKFRSTILVSI